MPTRTSDSLVRNVISTTLTVTQVEAFIADANLFVTEEIVPLAPTASDARLEAIERYLACALIRIRDLQITEAEWDDVREQYQVDPEVSEYLTRAAALDPTGKIRETFMAPKDQRPVRFRVGEGYRDDYISGRIIEGVDDQ